MNFSTRPMNLLALASAVALLPVLAIGACDKEPTTAPEPIAAPAEAAPDTSEADAEAEAAEAAATAEAEAKQKAADAKAALDAQIAQGEELYGAKCAGCHGDEGQGKGKTPRLIGADALSLDPAKGAKSRKGVKFATAADVAGYVIAQMPPKKAGTLSPEEYYAILAFDLNANGIDLTESLTEANAAAITVNAVEADDSDKE